VPSRSRTSDTPGAHEPPRVPPSWNLGKMAALYEELLGQANDGGFATFEAALSQPVLAVHFHDHIERSELERRLELRDTRQHLNHIFQHPRRILRSHEQVLSASRAKRISPRAILDLTTRSSRWRRRTLRGIEPREVLALVHEDLVDRYENRLAADFADRVVAQLTERLDRLRATDSMFEIMEEFQGSAGGGTKVWYRLRERLYRLWGSSADHLSETRRRLGELRSSIERLRDRFLAYRSLPLYSELAASHQVPDAIHETNILINDQHYCHLPPLWQVMLEGKKRPSRRRTLSEEKMSEYDGRLLLRFALGVVAQALRSLRFCGEDACTPGEAWQLVRDGEKLSVGLAGEHRSELVLTSANTKGRMILQIVPVAGVGSNSTLRDQLGEWISKHRRHPDEERLLIVSGGQSDAGVEWSDDGVFPVLSVSPFDLWSVERVGRAIRYWLDGSRLRAFPFELEGVLQSVRETFPPDVPVEWSERSKAFLVWGVLPPSQAWRLRRALRQHEQVDLEKLHGAVDAAQRRIEALLRCPVCGESGEFADEPDRQHRTYHARCRSCSSEWGVAGSHRYPFIHVGPEERQTLSHAGMDGLGRAEG